LKDPGAAVVERQLNVLRSGEARLHARGESGEIAQRGFVEYRAGALVTTMEHAAVVGGRSQLS